MVELLVTITWRKNILKITVPTIKLELPPHSCLPQDTGKIYTHVCPHIIFLVIIIKKVISVVLGKMQVITIYEGLYNLHSFKVGTQE